MDHIEDEYQQLLAEGFFNEADVAQLKEWELERERQKELADPSPEETAFRDALAESIITRIMVQLTRVAPEEHGLDGRAEREDALLARIRSTLSSMTGDEIRALWRNTDARERLGADAVAELESWIENSQPSDA